MPPQLSPKHAGDAKVDGLTFQFLKTQNTKVAIQADVPWKLLSTSPSDAKVLYYEVQVVDLPSKSCVAVGIATANFPVVDALPGRTQGSYGYYGDQGQLFAGASVPVHKGSLFGRGDIVGVGVDTTSGELFFTKNGAALGVTTKVEKEKVYLPTVGTDAKSTLRFNFDGPFVFKVDKPVVPSLVEKKGEGVVIPSQAVWHEKPRGTNGHIMISYQWDSKEFALQIYEALTARGFVVWMDVKGGMSGDIYQSMAEGVEGAVLIVPLLTAKYAASPNCRRECSAAADKRKKILPLMCENINITGWLLACISGLLWTECFNHKISKENLEHFLGEVEKVIPVDSPAREPNLSIYISYSPRDKDSAEVIKKLLEAKQPPLHCIMSAQERFGNTVTTPRADGKRSDGVLQRSAALEEKLTNAKAVVLVYSSSFESSDACKNDVSLSFSHQKLIIPVLVKRPKDTYPHRVLEFALSGLPYLDCISMIQIPARHSTISRKLTEALINGAVIKSANVDHKENFLIKNVGTWTEKDVSDWLNSVELSQYASVFQAKHVNGRVLLGLHEKDLDSLQVMKIHQRRFHSAVSTLFNGLNWTEDAVAEWMESVGLSELTPNLFKAHINGQSLLMLTESDLTANDISDAVTQKRILSEIQYLKEREARVPPKDDKYKFKVLRSVLKLVTSDTKEDNFKFSKEILELLRHIFSKVIDDRVETEAVGLNQAALKKFLFTLLVCAGIYHDSYPTKNIWNDLNVVELLSLKSFADTMLEDIDALLLQFGSFEGSCTTDHANALALQLKSNKIFRILCFNYLILNKIVDRLFLVFDRHADGVVSWTELLPSIELIIHGSVDDKLKLAMSLVDEDGNGNVSKEEFHVFYQEFFLPIVNFCQLVRLADFDKLTKDSFLYTAYQKVKDVMSIDREPRLLNKSFSVKQYQGSLKDKPADLDDIFNVPWDSTPFVWLPYGHHPHELKHEKDKVYTCDVCSSSHKGEAWCCKDCNFDLCPSCHTKRSSDPATNVDILGIYTAGAEFSLTNITLGGQFNCATTGLVKHALLWVTSERPDLGAYAKFNNFTKAQADAYKGDDKPLFITADPTTNYMAYVDLKQAVVGKYVLIKLLNAFTEEETREAEVLTKKPGDKKEANEEADRQKKERGLGEEGGSKCLVVEFIGLWGYDEKRVDSSSVVPSDARKLFATLAAKYDAFCYSHGETNGEQGALKINKYVAEFLRAARDVSDGDDITQDAKEVGVEKREVVELLRRINYLTAVGTNPANTLMLLLPLLHLLRLFYGYDAADILLQPM